MFNNIFFSFIINNLRINPSIKKFKTSNDSTFNERRKDMNATKYTVPTKSTISAFYFELLIKLYVITKIRFGLGYTSMSIP